MTGWLVLAAQCVRDHEGCSKPIGGGGMFQAYPDPASGGAPWTIGWGSTGPDVTKGTVWSQAQCDARLLHDLVTLGGQIDELCKGIPVNNNEKAALCSIAYNIGIGRLEESTLLRKFRDGNVAGAADEFLKWHFANSKSMPGLIKRRADERTLFLSTQP